ncbi:MAG TPA: N-6 DNA methylase [Candidatus Pacearchaeota archaeon]|nr:N-6 DNA methylase [Candidatus Pacearchaeota archaeon]
MERFKKPRCLQEGKMVEIKEENIYDFLKVLGFKLKDGTENTYKKVYSGYEIKITIDDDNFRNSKIDYGEKITIERATTINFSQQENFVILECINRLLEKGYKPEKIVLEKNFPLGHREGGSLDIQILDDKNKSFLMIECKTFGKEYEKEIKKTRSDGGQIFSYFIQDKDTEYLCLYTSLFEDKKIIYKNSIIKVVENIKTATNKQEAYENWKPQVFEEKGIFEEDIKPYIIEFKGLVKNDLEPLTKRDGGNIFNAFAEILRRNVVSDKTNAYNKIFNLFLCKIVDEYERNNNDELEFQWKEGEANEDVLLRLNNLYKRGMEKYLDLKISSVNLEEITNLLNSLKTEKDREEIKKLFIQQKLYTSNDFAFKEVFDKNTFDLNCIVVKEVVKLLEKYKIRYETKQQFLGDFFEKLLNTGIKQEVGQFFTPVPIAQFISKSLPIWEIVNDRNNKDEIHILPYCIDYASGAGHFLTEIMAEINSYIDTKIDKDFIKNGRAKKEYNSYKNNFDWAKEYIYGIEKDYRLAKTTKISTFLNGDGDATIICGDGLDNFNKSKDYKGKLKSSEDKKEINNFDIVVSNPPYSVSGFKTAIENGKDSFDLYDIFTDKSKEIECLFIERTKQLLRKNGVAGIILPSSILSNTGIYSRVRELILENFEIKGIVELGANTFMATGINTIILFLKKIENKKEDISYYVDKSLREKKDLTINGIEKPISKFLKLTYKIDFSDFVSLLNKKPNEKIVGLDIFRAYKKLLMKRPDVRTLIKKTDFKNLSEEEQKKVLEDKLYEFIILSEKNKIIYFVLTYGKKVVVSNIPTNKKEEMRFLGYKFSNRRGYEGINIFKFGGKLYNPKEVRDKTKVNYYILENFLDKVDLGISEEANSVKIVDLSSMLELEKADFEKQINLYSRPEINFKEGTKIERLGDKVEVKIGGTPSRLNDNFFTGDNLWVSIEEMNGEEITDTKEKLTDEGIKNSNCKLIKKGTTLLSFKLSIGKTAIAGKDLYTNEAIAGLEIKDKFKKEVFNEYLYYFFSSRLSKLLLTKNNNVFGKSLNKPFLEGIKMPFPDKTIQKEIISKLSEIDNKKVRLKENLLKKNNEIENLFQEAFSKYEKVKLGTLISEDNLISGKRPSGGVFQYEEGVISLGGENVGKDGKLDLSNINYVPDEFYEENKDFEVEENDVLMCKDGALTGKVAIVDNELKEPFIVNEHLFIIRGDEDKLNQKYLFYSLYPNDFQVSLREKAKKMGQSGISREGLFDLEIPYPKKEIQDKIIEKVEEKEKEIENLKEQIDELDNEKEKVLTKYLLE